MFCPVCRNLLPDNAKFCGFCGSRLGYDQAQVHQSYQQGASSPYGQPTYPGGVYGADPRAQQAYQQAHQGYQQTQAVPLRQPIDPSNSAKWALADIRSTKGWIKRVILLALMNCFPLLGWYATGYAMRWGVEAASNPRGPLPKQTFDARSLMYGIMYFVQTMLMYVTAYWIFVLNVIPILGTIVAVVLAFVASTFVALAALRMAVFGKARRAFDMSAVFEKLRIKRSGLFKAYLVPWLIALGIALALTLVLSILCILIGSLFAAGMQGASMATGGDPPQQLMMMITGAFASAMWLFAVGGILIYLLTLFLLALAELWSFRSLGYWLAGYATDWLDAADVEKAQGSTGQSGM